MPIIAPTITAETEESFQKQIEKVNPLAVRLHIDFSDGQFAPRKLLPPSKTWWPVGLKTDFHLMYQQPGQVFEESIRHKPHLIILHAESGGDFKAMAEAIKSHEIKVGVALLPQTQPNHIMPALELIDHVLIFSGNLGYQGGSYADPTLLNKVLVLRDKKPSLEIGWDGGINPENISELILGGVDVLNVGGYIQAAHDPAKAFKYIQRIADETGTT